MHCDNNNVHVQENRQRKVRELRAHKVQNRIHTQPKRSLLIFLLIRRVYHGINHKSVYVRRKVE